MSEPHNHVSADSERAPFLAWLDAQIEEAAAGQKRSYASAGLQNQVQGERYHARQAALYEAKMKFLTDAHAQAARDPGEEDVAIALFLARHHGLTNIMPWDDIEHDGRDYWRTIARNLMRTHRVVPASQPSPAATVETRQELEPGSIKAVLRNIAQTAVSPEFRQVLHSRSSAGSGGLREAIYHGVWDRLCHHHRNACYPDAMQPEIKRDVDDLVGFICEEAARITAVPQSAWKPMETAPQDGTQVVLNSRTVPYVGAFRRGYPEEPQSWELGWRSSCCGRFTNPTGWSPLPRPTYCTPDGPANCEAWAVDKRCPTCPVTRPEHS